MLPKHGIASGGVGPYLLYFDGGCRDNQTAYAYLILKVLPDNQQMVVFSKSGRCGRGSSNEAEYRALCLGIQKCLELGYKNISIFGDSRIVVQQVKGKWNTTDPKLSFLLGKVKQGLHQLEAYRITWIRRHLNKMADDLVCGVFKRSWPRRQCRR